MARWATGDTGAVGSDTDAVTIESDRLRVVTLPAYGGKVVSILDRATEREWLAQPEGRGYAQRPLDADYARSDASGWDECFPSIAPGRHPASPWQDVPLPDHGELWQRPWSNELIAGELVNRIEGARFPYCFERRLSVSGEVLTAAYRVDNLGDEAFPCLWSMHPLFAAGRETRLVLPPSARLRVAISFGGDFTGPLLTPEEVERALDSKRVRACKLFCEDLPVGRAALFDTRTAVWIGLTFDLTEVPVLGIWLNRGGWPPDAPLHHIALEPTTGSSDDLAEALRRGTGIAIPPRAAASWKVGVVVGSGRDAVEKFVA
jgi:galactose mutarotase-like enzyme